LTSRHDQSALEAAGHVLAAVVKDEAEVDGEVELDAEHVGLDGVQRQMAASRGVPTWALIRPNTSAHTPSLSALMGHWPTDPGVVGVVGVEGVGGVGMEGVGGVGVDGVVHWCSQMSSTRWTRQAPPGSRPGKTRTPWTPLLASSSIDHKPTS